MKVKILSIGVLSCIFLMTSCTKLIYTNEQVLSRYTDKTLIVARFGLPTQKKVDEGIEEWVYDFGTSYVGMNNRITNSVNVSRFNQYDRFLKFTLDDRGNMVKWSSQGVDLAEREKDRKKTFWAVILFVVVPMGLGAWSGSM